jgi:Ferritin-like domain
LASSKFSRNQFLHLLLGSAGVLLLTPPSCKPLPTGGNGLTDNGYSFGAGDIGLLNYLYVVEQIQYQFYLKWIQSGLNGFDLNTVLLINDIALHQLTHTEFYKSALGTNALPTLTLDFTTIDFNNKSTILPLAGQFQNNEIEAYIGVSRYFQSSAFLTVSQQIASVEARHSAFITGLSAPNNFIDPTKIDSGGNEISQTPSLVLGFYKPYLKTPLDINTLPQS